VGETPHGYTPQLHRAIFTWFNSHLKNDPTPVAGDVMDFVEPEEKLLVLDGKLPAEDEMCRIDKLLVHRADLLAVTDEAAWQVHQEAAIKRSPDGPRKNSAGRKRSRFGRHGNGTREDLARGIRLRTCPKTTP
jgi:hypothetical protein